MILIIIPSVIVFFSLIFSLIARKYNNPYKLYLVFGKKGSGKTTFLVKKAIHYLNLGWNVYTNIDDMCMPGLRHFIPTDLGNFVPENNSVLLIDEINLFWDNRDFKSFPKSTQKFFRLQRHYKVLIYCASQTYDCDKKIRDQTDMMYLCTSWKNIISIARPIIKKPVVTVSDSQSESRISEDLKILPFFSWKFTLIPRYKSFYNSFAVDGAASPIKYTSDPDDPDFRKHFKRLRRSFKIRDRRNNPKPSHKKGNRGKPG